MNCSLTDLDNLLDDPFHGSAWRAYFEIAAHSAKPPGAEDTRRLAFTYYEQELAEQNRSQLVSNQQDA